MDRASDSISAMQMLRELAEVLAAARTEEEVCQLATALFQRSQGRQQDPANWLFVLLYLLSEDRCHARLCGITGLLPDSPAVPLQVDLQVGPDPWLLTQVAQTGKPRQVNDQECIGTLIGNDISQISRIETVLVVPVAKPGQQRPYGMLVVGINPQQWLHEEYHDFCFLAAYQIATAIATVEHTRLYQQSQETIQMRDELLATISHDLKNPLGAIKGYTQLLHRLVRRSAFPEPEQLSISLVRIDATTARMTAMLNELMDQARAQLEQPIELLYGSLDYVALLLLVITRRPQTLPHMIRLETTLTTLPGRGDIARLERIFSNLLSNAIRHDSDRGSVLITLNCEEQNGGSLAVIEVCNQGMDIPAADLTRIFEPFRRAINVGMMKGTSVSLFSAKQIIELHGGTIAVQSVEGQGSTFIVRLPLYPEEA